MPTPAKWCARASLVASAILSSSASAQTVTALPEQTSRIRLSNRDVNHVVCVGGEMGDVKFSAEKGLVVERGGSDAWIKFLIHETDDPNITGAGVGVGAKTRSYVTTPAEFFIACNEAIYPLYAEPADISAQTVILAPGAQQRARANDALLGPLVEEERAVSIILSILQDRVPASFADIAPTKDRLALAALPTIALTERRRFDVEGAGLSASEYRVQASLPVELDELSFLDSALGPDVFALTLDRLTLAKDEAARLIVVRRNIVR